MIFKSIVWLTYLNAAAAAIGCAYVTWEVTGWIGLLVCAAGSYFWFYALIFLIPILALIIPPHIWWLALMVYGGTFLVNTIKKAYLVKIYKENNPNP